MEQKPLDFTKEEAGIIFSALIAFSDDNPSKEEGAIMRKYYPHTAAETVQSKLSEAGLLYPNDLERAIEMAMPILKAASKNYQLRTLAIAYQLAQADGKIDQEEMNLLNKYAGVLETTLFEAKQYGETRLKEVAEGTETIADDDEEDFRAKEQVPYNHEEAALALATLVAFRDDNPTEKEMGVIREYFTFEVAESLQDKMSACGYQYPQELAQTEKAIMAALATATREYQLRALAIAYKTASADAHLDPKELELLKTYCEEFIIGLAEVKEYFKAIP